MKISVVLSTYNGEKFIIEQLESIRIQSLKPDEVLIFDDCSSDNTVSIIKKFISDYSLNYWKIYVNLKNLGWRCNFYQGLKKVKGDYIFTCDQDDIWNAQKIEKMVDELEKNSQILLLASNYIPLYMEGGMKVTSPKSLKNESDYSVKKINSQKEMFYIMRPGCTYAFRKELLKYFFEVFDAQDGHDALLWRIAGLMEGLYVYNYPLIQFRRHSNNATGREVKNTSRRLRDIKYYYDLIKRLELFSHVYQKEISEENLKYLKKYLNWIELRMCILQSRSNIKKISYWFKLSKYIDNYYSLKSYFSDFYFLILFRGV